MCKICMRIYGMVKEVSQTYYLCIPIFAIELQNKLLIMLETSLKSVILVLFFFGRIACSKHIKKFFLMIIHI